MYDETRGPRMGRGGGDVLVVPVMTAMLSAETVVDDEAARDDEDERADDGGSCSRMPPLTQVKPRVAATTAEQQLLRDRRWAMDTARRGDFVMLVLGVLGVANGSSAMGYHASGRHQDRQEASKIQLPGSQSGVSFFLMHLAYMYLGTNSLVTHTANQQNSKPNSYSIPFPTTT